MARNVKIIVVVVVLTAMTALTSSNFRVERKTMLSAISKYGYLFPDDAGEPDDPIEAAQIPPLGYPWATVGAHYPSADPSVLAGIEHMMARGSNWVSGESPFFTIYIRNGVLWGDRGDLVEGAGSPGVMQKRMGTILNMLQTTLNLAKILKKRACGDEPMCSNVTDIHPRMHELLDLEDVTIPLIITPHDLFNFNCGNSKLLVFSLQAGVKPIASDWNCSSISVPFPTYALWKPLVASSMHKRSDWTTQKNATASESKGDMYTFEGNVSTQLESMANERSSSMWELGFPGMEAMYPWANKTSQAVWRGRRTARIRDHLAAAAFDSPDILDIGLIDKGDERARKPPMALEDFMKYKAIVDVDGRAWSSRFGNLLCMNSVVIKIEPKFTDYWHNDLLPWKHYVPVQNDLSDLDESTRYVLHPANDKKMKKIVRNANEWCRNKMTVTQLSVDMLWILFSYLDMVTDAVEVQSPGTSLSTQLSRWGNMTSIDKLISLEREAVFSSLLKSE